MGDDAAGGDAKCSSVVIDGGANLMGGLMAVTGIMAAVLVLSGLFHSVLRRMGQPSVISHILAGIVVGPTFLGRAVDLQQIGMKDPGRELGGAIKYLRVLFMFFIGIELDLRYLRHKLRPSLAIACGGFSLCLVFAMLGGTFFYSRLMHPDEFPFEPDKLRDSTALFALVLTSTASPVLIRIVTELKLTGSEIGQLAIGAAFANDMASLAALSFVMVRSTVFGATFPSPTIRAAGLAAMALSLWVTIGVATWAARLLNRLKRGTSRYISTYELCGLLLLVSCLAEFERIVGYSNTIGGFLMGLAMPRDGPTARTIVDRLAYPVHQILMPLCFADIGARLDIARVELFNGWRLAEAVAFATLLSTAGSVVGTVLAGRALGLTAGDAVILGFLLNVKGYADVLAINFGDRIGVWGETEQAVLLLSSIVNTFMAGLASAAIVRQQRRAFSYQSRCLQDRRAADHELSVLACVHGAAGVHSMLALADLSRAGSVHLLHLVELVTSSKYTITHHFFHVRDDEDGDEDDWGSAREIEQVAAAVAAYTSASVPIVRQTTAISSLASMDADVRNGAEDARASLVLVPHHKELRYDGRLVCRRDGRRLLNQRILQRAPPCTVGVLVERQRLLGEAAERVVALFRGGPDDREAVAYAARLAAHPLVASVTVCRFLPRWRAVVVHDEAAMADEEFMADMHARLVLTGQVVYTERYVSGGAEMMEALSAMAVTYSLIILGRSGGGAGAEAMTRDLGDWGGELPELGPVGEVLASDDFRGCGSVLVLQQHSMYKTKTTKQGQPPEHSTAPWPC